MEGHQLAEIDDSGHGQVLDVDSRLLGAADGVEAPDEDHAHLVEVHGDLANGFADLADGEHAVDARGPEVTHDRLREVPAQGGDLAEVGQDPPLALGDHLPHRGHPGPDERLRGVQGGAGVVDELDKAQGLTPGDLHDAPELRVHGDAVFQENAVDDDAAHGGDPDLALRDDRLAQPLAGLRRGDEPADAEPCLERGPHGVDGPPEFLPGDEGDVHGHQPAFPSRIEGGPEGERLDPGDGQAELVADAGAADLLDPSLRDGPAVAPARQLRQTPLVRQAQMVPDHPLAQGDTELGHAPRDETRPHRLPGVAEDPEDQQHFFLDVGRHHGSKESAMVCRWCLSSNAGVVNYKFVISLCGAAERGAPCREPGAETAP